MSSHLICHPFGPNPISLVDKIPLVFMSTHNSRHSLIEYYSAPWAIRWEGCPHYKGLLYTTPNQDVIWVPGNTRDGVYLRADLRYAPHDPTLWPQLYVPDLCHLGAIPSKPMDPDNPLSIMWWNPTRGDFISSEFSVLDGLGKFSSARYARFQTMKGEIVHRVLEYRRKNPKPNNWVFALETMLVHACTRLGQLSTT